MAASMDDEADLVDLDDYYAWLGLSKEVWIYKVVCRKTSIEGTTGPHIAHLRALEIAYCNLNVFQVRPNSRPTPQ